MAPNFATTIGMTGCAKRRVKLGNPDGAAAYRRFGKGGAALRMAVRGNSDTFAEGLRPVLEEISAGGTVTLRGIAAELNAPGIITRRSGRWQVGKVINLLARTDVEPTFKMRAALYRDHPPDGAGEWRSPGIAGSLPRS